VLVLSMHIFWMPRLIMLYYRIVTPPKKALCRKPTPPPATPTPKKLMRCGQCLFDIFFKLLTFLLFQLFVCIVARNEPSKTMIPNWMMPSFQGIVTF
jgi:hypothetical protein